MVRANMGQFCVFQVRGFLVALGWCDGIDGVHFILLPMLGGTERYQRMLIHQPVDRKLSQQHLASFLAACRANPQDAPEGGEDYVQIGLRSPSRIHWCLELLRRHRVCPFDPCCHSWKASWSFRAPSPTRRVTCELGTPSDGLRIVSQQRVARFLPACHTIPQERPEGAGDYAKMC